jgi:hypothetical protein
MIKSAWLYVREGDWGWMRDRLAPHQRGVLTFRDDFVLNCLPCNFFRPSVSRARTSHAPGPVGRMVFTPDLKSGIPLEVLMPAARGRRREEKGGEKGLLAQTASISAHRALPPEKAIV